MLQLGSHLRATTDREGAILLDLVRGQVFRSNASGALVIDLLLRGSDQAEMARALADRFGLPADQASADVDSFLAVLRAGGFLEEGQER